MEICQCSLCCRRKRGLLGMTATPTRPRTCITTLVFRTPTTSKRPRPVKTWCRALAEGCVFQFRIWLWALRHDEQARPWIVAEGLACAGLLALAAALCPVTPIFLVYAVLMVMGSWIIPLVTSYLPHDPHGKSQLVQTRVFRGRLASLIALEHLYHLEHHLYPAVPHHNWPKLARRLDPHFAEAGVKPIRFWI